MATMTLIERLRYYHEYDCRKHELAPNAIGYAEAKINAMTNVELVEALSEAMMEAGVYWQMPQ